MGLLTIIKKECKHPFGMSDAEWNEYKKTKDLEEKVAIAIWKCENSDGIPWKDENSDMKQHWRLCAKAAIKAIK